MKSKLTLVTPAVEFLQFRSSTNLIKLLGYLSQPNADIPENVVRNLIETSELPVIKDHENLFDFDEDVWNSFAQLNCEINWLNFIVPETVDPQQENISNDLRPDSFARELADVLSINDAILEDIKITGNNSLLFFSEINSLLKDEKVFKSFINTSSEIADILINILQDDSEVIRHSRKYITEGYWEWIFPSLCMAYINYLDEDNSLDIETNFSLISEKRAADEMVGLCSLLMLQWLSIADFKNTKYATCFAKYYAMIKCINHENRLSKGILSLFLATAEKESEDSLSHSLVNEDYNSDVRAVVFSIIATHLYLRPKAYEVLIDALFGQYHEIHESKIADLLHRPLQMLLANYLLNTTPTAQQASKSYFSFVEGINSTKVQKMINEVYIPGPNITALVSLIRNATPLTFWHDVFDAKDELISKLVELINIKNDKESFPQSLKFISPHEFDQNYFYLDPFPQYYKCISTLGINLLNNELSDSWLDFQYTRNFVEGAEALLKAGYTDYALVFLGYGLLRIKFGMIRQRSSVINENNYAFSVSLVNDFISKSEVWTGVEKHFLPFIDIILNSAQPISLAERLWLIGINEKFKVVRKNGSAEVIWINPTKPVSLSSECPQWFKDDENSISSLTNLLDAVNKLNNKENKNTEAWDIICTQSKLNRPYRDLLDELQAKAIMIFKPFFFACLSNIELRESVGRLKINLNTEKDFTLGAIAVFMKTVQSKAKHQDPEYEKLHAIAKDIDICHSKLITMIADINPKTISDFYFFTSLRNYSGHRDDHMKKLEATQVSWLYYYANIYFGEFYKLSQALD